MGLIIMSKMFFLSKLLNLRKTPIKKYYKNSYSILLLFLFGMHSKAAYINEYKEYPLFSYSKSLKSYIRIKRPLNYSINLMWVNREPSSDQQNICPFAHYLDILSSWAIKNPEGIVNFWFNGQYITEEAKKST